MIDREIIITTERLWLSPFHESDAEVFYNLNNDNEVMRYTGDVAFESVEDSLDFILGYDHYYRYGYGRWTVILQDTEETIGWCGLKYHPDEDYVDLGYRLIRSHWGRGYATEAARACIHHGFEALGLDRIVGRTAKENTASVRVLEKAGLNYWKTAPCEGIENSVYYRISKGE